MNPQYDITPLVSILSKTSYIEWKQKIVSETTSIRFEKKASEFEIFGFFALKNKIFVANSKFYIYRDYQKNVIALSLFLIIIFLFSTIMNNEKTDYSFPKKIRHEWNHSYEIMITIILF
jgi:hypothetical protein